jgi:alkaline phosphatase
MHLSNFLNLRPALRLSTIGIAVSLISACSLESKNQALPSHQISNSWYIDGKASLQSKESALPFSTYDKAKNVILFVGDGMGISTITASRILQGQLQGNPGEENFLSFEDFPYSGLSKTYNTDQQTPDSAGTMTAMMTGVKTDAGIISIAEDVERSNCESGKGHELITALELSELSGKSTGVVTTARLTHATPAATYSRSANRGWESDNKIPDSEKDCIDIAAQLINFEENFNQLFPNSETDGIEVLMGGGRRHFLPNDPAFNQENPEDSNAEGKRTDGRHLINEWKDKHPSGVYVNNEKGFQDIDINKSSHILGLFHPSHMRYQMDRKNDRLGEPSLKDMTMLALDKLSKNDNGYFLMVESGRIDHAHHAGNAYNALHDTIALSDAVKAVVNSVNLDETLIIVTADHSHVFTIAGYPKRGNDILGKVIPVNSETPALMEDGLPYTTLGYMNGPGMHDLGQETDADKVYFEDINVGRKDISNINTSNPGYHQEALIPRESETHGGEDVGIYAIGPGAHLVSGVNEQNVIFHVMAHAAGLVEK